MTTPCSSRAFWTRRRRHLRLASRAHARVTAHLVDSVLAHLGAPAFIVDDQGRIRHANEAAKKVDTDREREVIGQAVRENKACAGYSLTRIDVTGSGTYFLAVRARPLSGDLSSRIRVASDKWQLSPRQVEVLESLCEGAANKDMAARFACSLRTIEVHVSALLRKAKAESRMALLAALFTLPDPKALPEAPPRI